MSELTENISKLILNEDVGTVEKEGPIDDQLPVIEINSNHFLVSIKVLDYIADEHIISIPVESGIQLSDNEIVEEVHGYIYENAIRSLNANDYDVQIQTNSDASSIVAWVTTKNNQALSQYVELVTRKLKKEIAKQARTLKSYDAAKLAELQTHTVEFEEKEMNYQREIITVRVEKSKEKKEFEEKLSEKDARIQALEVALRNQENSFKLKISELEEKLTTVQAK